MDGHVRESRDKKVLMIQMAFFGGMIAINFILPRSAGALGLPLYLDNVGTLAAAVLGGYLPGIAVDGKTICLRDRFQTVSDHFAHDPNAKWLGAELSEKSVRVF